MKRKPAIDFGGSRPQGVLDDIVRPIIQKGAKAVAKKTLSQKSIDIYRKFPKSTSMGRAIRGGQKGSHRIGRKALDISDEMARKRARSYESAARKAYETGKSPKKIDVLSSKARAARNQAGGLRPNASVRKAAKGARRRGGYR